MILKFFPRKKIYFKFNDLEIFIKLLLKGQLLKGNNINLFEKKLAKYLGTKNVLTVFSGRSGLDIILKSLNLKTGTEIILPAFTYHAIPKIIKNNNCIPVFIDIKKDTFNINTEKIAEKITKKTKVIIATHMFGEPCNLNEILKIADDFDLFVIEDCAQAIGTNYKNKKVGTYGNCSIFSFESFKPLNTYGGGAIATNNDKLFSKIQKHYLQKKQPPISYIFKRFLFSVFEIITLSNFFNKIIYFYLLLKEIFHLDLKKIYKKFKNNLKKTDYQYTNFQATIGLSRLNEIRTILKKRHQLVNSFNDFSEKKLSKDITYALFINCENTNKIKKHLLIKGIETDNAEDYRITDSNGFPNTQKTLQTAIQLPLHNYLTEKDIKYFAKAVKDSDKCY